jgi:hypothetical protein
MAKRASHVAARRAVAGLVSALLLTTAGCGGDGEAAPQPKPQSSEPTPSVSATPSESPTPSPSPTVKPLSRFEDEPPVQAAREWAERYARAVNRGHRDFAGMASIMTRRGQQVLPQLAAEDFGLYYPGPLPFTPTGVRRNGGTARVVGCYWVEGFALKQRGGVPAKDRLVIPALLRFKKRDGQWKFDGFFDHDHACGNIPVKGIGW